MGKSALVLRFTADTFGGMYKTTVQTSSIKLFDYRGQTYEMRLLDTAGQEDFHAVRSKWIQNKDALIFVVSLDRLETTEIESYLNIINSHGVNPKMIALVVAKYDLFEEYQSKPGVLQGLEKLRTTLPYKNWMYFETSSKTGYNVQKLFESLLEKKLQEDKRSKEKKIEQHEVVIEPVLPAQSFFSKMWDRFCCRNP